MEEWGRQVKPERLEALFDLAANAPEELANASTETIKVWQASLSFFVDALFKRYPEQALDGLKPWLSVPGAPTIALMSLSDMPQ